MAEPLPRGTPLPDEDEDDGIEEIDVNDLPPLEREYFLRLKVQRSMMRVSAENMPIQQVQIRDNT